MGDVIDRGELARLLRTCPRRLPKLIATGLIPAPFTGVAQRRQLWHRAAVLEHLERRQRLAAEAQGVKP